MKTSLLVLFNLLFFYSVAFAQSPTTIVQGTVTDDSGMPIPGVNVIQKGTSNGVVTDFDGNFTIEVPQDAVLVFSYLGYAPRVSR